MAKVFLVDDETTMVQMVSELLRNEGHEVFAFSDGCAALAAMDTIAPQLVITDLYLERTRAMGLELLKKARALSPPAIVIVITGFASIETAVEAMKRGAYDYLEKPFKLDDLKLCVQRALSYNEAITENIYLRKQLKKKYKFSQIIGTAPPIMEVFKIVERVSDTDSTILILGESGTGKELIARALHYNSHRQFATFIPVNCSALPENLLESELFGHRKGSFTGAISDKKGLFQEAEGGTIFLDEIGSMSPMLQSRLLRVMQDREVRRVGDNTPIYVNVRVLAATNEPLEKKMKEGHFREDLYYRLNVIPIRLPALRERRDDIPLLVNHFLKDRIHPRLCQPFLVTRAAMQAFNAYNWPGNVRELENAIERACVLSEDNIIRVTDLPPNLHRLAKEPAGEPILDDRNGVRVQAGEGGSATVGSAQASQSDPARIGREMKRPTTLEPVASLKEFLREQELAFINRALTQAGGNRERAAKLLAISVATLYRRLAEEGIPEKEDVETA